MPDDAKPQPPPEAVLIRLARQGAHVKVSAARKRADISVARWSQIENGYETRGGKYKAVTGSAETIAHMAYAVGLSPDRLETEGNRPDAAEILTEIQRQRHKPGLSPLGKQLAQRAMELYPQGHDWETFSRLPGVGVDPELVKAIETGRRTEFSDAEICDLAHAYQMAESDLRQSLSSGELIISDGGQSVSEGEAFVRSQHLTDAEWSAVAEIVRAFRGMGPSVPAPEAGSPDGTRRSA